MIDSDEFDEESKAKRRKEQIEYRNKKRFSNLFTFLATIFEIIETFAVMVACFVLGSVVIKLFNFQDEQSKVLALQIVAIVCFIGGFVLGFIIFKKIMGFVIRKFKLEDKLLDSITMHYIKSKAELKEEQNQNLKR